MVPSGTMQGFPVSLLSFIAFWKLTVSSATPSHTQPQPRISPSSLQRAIWSSGYFVAPSGSEICLRRISLTSTACHLPSPVPPVDPGVEPESTVFGRVAISSYRYHTPVDSSWIMSPAVLTVAPPRKEPTGFQPRFNTSCLRPSMV